MAKKKNFPDDLHYTKEHEWCRVEGDVATIGITWHAQDALGDIVYVELPAIGEMVSAGQTFGVVESVKAVSDLYAPVSGEVLERNGAILEAPEDLNEDTYDDGWMIKVQLTDLDELGTLMTSEAYQKFLEEEGAD
jgi:glycine cleavage system H protein